MTSSFQFDGAYEMVIAEDAPRAYGDPRNVTISLMQKVFAVVTGDSITPAHTEHVVTLNMKPSHARAVASALLSAATEAKS